MNFAELGIKVDTTDAASAADDLDRLGDAAESAEAAVDGLANASKGLASAEAGASQAAERSASARERQATASRRVYESAAGEIAILNQMDKAVVNAAQSRESLGLANEMFVKAQERGLITAEEEVRILADLDKAERTVEAARLKSAMAMERERTQLEALATTGDSSAKRILTLERAIERMNQAIAKGHPDADKYTASIKRMQGDLEGLRNPGQQAGGVIDTLGLKSKSARQNVAQLGNALSSGNWRVAANNLVEIGNGANLAGSGMMFALGPAALLAGAIGVVTAAYIRGDAETQAFRRSLISTGDAAGTTTGALTDMAARISAATGTSGKAGQLLAELAASGKVATEQFEQVTKAVIAWEIAGVQAASETVAQFSALAGDPVNAVAQLNDKYNFLTASVYRQIQALYEQGDAQGATELAVNTYAQTVQTRAGEVTENLGWIEKAWNGIKSATNGAIEAAANVGREDGYAERIKKADADIQLARDQLTSSESAKRSKTRQQALEDALLSKQFLLDEIEGERQVADQRAFSADQLSKGIESEKESRKAYEETRSTVERLGVKLEELGKARDKQRTAGLWDDEKERKHLETVQRYQDQIASANARGTKGANGGTRDDAGQARVDAITRQNALLEAQRNAVHNLSAGEKELLSFNLEVAAIKERKILTTQQKQLLAHEEEIKAQLRQKIELEQVVKLDAERLKLAQFRASLESQQAQDQQGLDDSLKSLGLGDKEQRRLQEELRITEDYTRQMRRLRDQNNQGQLSDDLYRQETAALEDALRTRLQMQRDYYDEVDKAQGDWTLGARAAYANYLDSARDIAGQSQQLFTNAFSSMEDAVVQFAITGKLSFADFAKSVIADMARIAARQAMTGLLGNVVSIGMSAAGSYFGAGAASAGSTQAGYSGTDFSNWVAGQRATGGPVSANSLYEVNEKGPELLEQGGRTYLMMGGQGGSVTPLGAGPMSLAAASAGASAPSQVYVEVNIASDGNSSVSTNQPGLQQFGDELGKFVDQRYRKLVTRDLAVDGAIGRKMVGR